MNIFLPERVGTVQILRPGLLPAIHRRQNDPAIRRVFREALEASGVEIEALLCGRWERRATQAARQIARAMRDAGATVEAIGRRLNRHHTTISHLLQHPGRQPQAKKPPADRREYFRARWRARLEASRAMESAVGGGR